MSTNCKENVKRKGFPGFGKSDKMIKITFAASREIKAEEQATKQSPNRATIRKVKIMHVCSKHYNIKEGIL